MRLRLLALLVTEAGLALTAATSSLAAEPAGEPTILMGRVGGITDSEAILRGKLNPHGPRTFWHFEIGTTRAYTARTLRFGNEFPVAGEGFSGIEEPAFCLAPRTRYHYRLVAVNGTGTFYGIDKTFKTKPWRGGSREFAYGECPHGKPMR